MLAEAKKISLVNELISDCKKPLLSRDKKAIAG